MAVSLRERNTTRVKKGHAVQVLKALGELLSVVPLSVSAIKII